ncbi:NADH-quinone oxidoreductase subunit L, partial [Rhizobium ruizarguesonis]
VMLVPLYLLAIGAVLAGVIFEGRFYGEEYAEFCKGALFTGAENELVEEFHHVPALVGLSPFIAMVLGFVTAWYMYIRSPQ